MEYCAQDFKKESFLRNSKRDAIEFDGFDVEIGIGRNGIFSMNTRPTSNLSISIENIDFYDGLFRFNGTSDEEISTAYIDNVLDSKIIEYDAISEKIEDKYKISFSIPYEDILSQPIRKWEIKVKNPFKKMRVAKKFEFYRQYDKIYIINARNKLLISDDFYNPYKELNEKNEKIINSNKKNKSLKKSIDELKLENESLENKNNQLTEKNQKLKETINAYKNRFVVRLIDKIKKLFRF